MGILNWSTADSRNFSKKQESIDLFSSRDFVKNRQSTGQVAISIPLSRRGSALATLGDLTVGLNLAGSTSQNSAPQFGFGGSINWTPIMLIRLNASLSKSGASSTQSSAINGEEVSVKYVFDHRFGEELLVSWTNYNTNSFKKSEIDNFFISAAMSFLKNSVDWTNSYQQSSISNSFSEFPGVSPSMESAFPDRFVRDDLGHLVAVDARPIAVDRAVKSRFNSSLSWSGNLRHLKKQTGEFEDPIITSLSLAYSLKMKDRYYLPNGNKFNYGEEMSKLHWSLDINFGNSKFSFSFNLNKSGKFADKNGGVAFVTIPPLNSTSAIFINFGKIEVFSKIKAFKYMTMSIDCQNIFDRSQITYFSSRQSEKIPDQTLADPVGRRVQISLKSRF